MATTGSEKQNLKEVQLHQLDQNKQVDPATAINKGTLEKKAVSPFKKGVASIAAKALDEVFKAAKARSITDSAQNKGVDAQGSCEVLGGSKHKRSGSRVSSGSLSPTSAISKANLNIVTEGTKDLGTSEILSLLSSPTNLAELKSPPVQSKKKFKKEDSAKAVDVTDSVDVEMAAMPSSAD